MKPKIAIIHFGDVGKYPPAFNLIRYFAKSNSFHKIICCSRTTFNEKLDSVTWCNTTNKEKSNKLIRFLSYLYFYGKTFWCFMLHQPEILLYYETLSFPPVFVYYKLRQFFGKSTSIFCHYHEYTSPKEYETGMRLSLFAHSLEKKLYNKFSWISHTNHDRVAMFLEDLPQVEALKANVLPNYPPRCGSVFAKGRKVYDNYNPFKVVYVGSLDIESMYTKEFAEWVILQNGNVVWDVFSAQLNAATLNYFKNIQCSRIQFKGSILYDQLPFTLINYNAGVILYKGETLNYIYNEPNKYFEYYVCGLDTWYPKEMLGMRKNMQDQYKPFVRELDFRNLPDNLLQISHSKPAVTSTKTKYEAEDVYDVLLKHMNSLQLN